MAARRTRTSSSDAASSAITPQCSASSGSSATPASLTAGSGLRYLGWVLKRSRKDMGSLASIGKRDPVGPDCSRALPGVEFTRFGLAVRFLCEPLGDLLARHAMVVVQVHDHRGERAIASCSPGDTVSSPRRGTGTTSRDDRVSACRAHGAGGTRLRTLRRGRTTRPCHRSSCRSTGVRVSNRRG